MLLAPSLMRAVDARDYEEAKKAALARNPTCNNCECHCRFLMSKFLKPHVHNQSLLNPKSGDPDGFVSKDGMWAAVPLAGKKKGFCIIHNGSQVHSVKTYKQALDYIKKYSKIKKKATSSLEQFL